MSNIDTDTHSPPLLLALLPVISLMLLLSASVYLFGDNSSYGPNQIALLASAGLAQLIGHRHGWATLHAAMIEGISLSMGACLILLMVGMLIGVWMLSGTAPALIYYGLGLLEPAIFYPAACVICALVSVTIGSSWSTAGTVGVALIGIGQVMGMSPAITAGAIISGAYFGDKLSPLSDTTNLAPGIVGADLFEHIRYLLWTTLPAMGLALILYTVLTLQAEPDTAIANSVEATRATLATMYRISPVTLLPLLVLLVMASRGVAAYPTLAAGSAAGLLVAVFYQPETVIVFGAGDASMGSTEALIRGAWLAMADGFSANSGQPTIDTLLSRGGMSSMLNTVWLIISAMVFGASMERTGLLQVIVKTVLRGIHGTGSLIGATLISCIGINVLSADQYMSIVLPGRMYRLEFERRGLHPVTLSRTLEDAGTMTSALVPWNTCGAFMAATLGVPTSAYLWFAFLNLASPVIAAVYATLDFRIRRLSAS